MLSAGMPPPHQPSPSESAEREEARIHADIAVRLDQPRLLTIEQAIEWINDDELVEVTPAAIRVRKRILDHSKRKTAESQRLWTVAGADPFGICPRDYLKEGRPFGRPFHSSGSLAVTAAGSVPSNP